MSSISLHTTLLQAIQRLVELPDEVFLSGCSEAGWLAHVDGLVELPVEVRVLEIDLVDLQIVCGGES